jgi:nicotinamide-nucleotide amidase
MIAPLFESENPVLGIYSKVDGIHLRAIATARTEVEARELIGPMEAEIRGVVGDSIWGEDEETPESQVATLMKKRGQSLGIMESFTGGLLASNLAEIPGHREFLRGSIVTGSREVLERMGVPRELIDRFGEASPEIAEATALAAREQLGADVGVSVTGLSTGSEESGAPLGTCYTGFALGDDTSSVAGHYPTRRLRLRGRAATHALVELLRLLSG